MMGQHLSLESFETVLAEETGPSTDYNAGYQDGFAAAQAEVQADFTACQNALVQAIGDMQFTYAEAHSEILRGLVPLFTALVTKIVPQCVSDSFLPQLVDLLTSQARDEIAGIPTLSVHPERADSLRSILVDVMPDVRIISDPTLTPNAALISFCERETRIDADQLLMRVTTILNNITDTPNRTNQHG